MILKTSKYSRKRNIEYCHCREPVTKQSDQDFHILSLRGACDKAISNSGDEIRDVRSERRMRDSLPHFTFLFSRFPVGRLLRFARNDAQFVLFFLEVLYTLHDMARYLLNIYRKCCYLLIVIMLFIFILNTPAYPQQLQKKSFDKTPVQSKKEDEKKKEKAEIVVVPDVEYRSQSEKGKSQWCVVYSTYMLLTRYGIHPEPDEIAKKLGMDERSHSYLSWKSLFSNEGSVEKYIQSEHNLQTRKKIFVTLRKHYKKWIKKNLKKGNPILFLYGRVNGHAVLLVGYDEKYIYMNDPSGAFFREATKRLKKNIYPAVWCKEKRKSRYEHAGVLWSDLEKFLKKKNLWGYMIMVTGKKEEEDQ